jgi:hypothetical protein
MPEKPVKSSPPVGASNADAPRSWPKPDVARLRELYPRYRIREVAKLLGRKTEAVRSAIHRFGFGNRKYWTADEISRLRELYPAMSNTDLAQVFGRTRSAIDGAGSAFGLTKTPEYLAAHARLQKGARIGIEFQFQKGSSPVNKGVRRPGYAPGRMGQSQFVKGARPLNWKPIGTITTDVDGYQHIKAREPLPGEPSGTGNRGSWPFLHVHIWEQHHGPVPPGHVIAFKDGKRQDCAIGNLECISRADLARRNAMWNRFPPELIDAIQLNGALKRKLRRLQP